MLVRGRVHRFRRRLDVGDEPACAGDQPVRHHPGAESRVRLVVVAHHAWNRSIHSEPRGAVRADVHPTRAHDLAILPSYVLEPPGPPDQRLQPPSGLEAIDALEKLRPGVRALTIDKIDGELTTRERGALHKRAAVPNDPILRVERLEPTLAEPVLIGRRSAVRQ